MTVEEMKYAKLVLGLSDAEIAERAELTEEEVQMMLQEAGICDNMVREPLAYNREEPYPGKVQFYQMPKRQGEFTVEDWYNFPEDMWVELIDGVIYDVNTPSIVHQVIDTQLWSSLNQYITEKGGDCLPLVSPVSVQLDADDDTMVVPDLLVVCNRDLITPKCIVGAPDFVVEILSRSSRTRDRIVKLRKYWEAGVREYWIIDPWKRAVTVYFFEEEGVARIYGFEDKIPVRIYGGDCVIDFKPIAEYIDKFGLK